MARLPRKFKTGAVSHRVSFDKTLAKRNLNGLFTPDKYRIDISPSLNRTEKALTIIHECIHAVDDIANWKLNEKQVDQWSFILASLLVDNRELVEYLYSLLEDE